MGDQQTLRLWSDLDKHLVLVFCATGLINSLLAEQQWSLLQSQVDALVAKHGQDALTSSVIAAIVTALSHQGRLNDAQVWHRVGVSKYVCVDEVSFGIQHQWKRTAPDSCSRIVCCYCLRLLLNQTIVLMIAKGIPLRDWNHLLQFDDDSTENGAHPRPNARAFDEHRSIMANVWRFVVK